MVTPDNNLSFEFTKIGKNAYKIDDVDEYVAYNQKLIKQHKSEKEDLENKIIVLAEKIEEYRKDEDSLKAALLGAQRFGDNIVKEAKSKAEVILRDANIKAEYALNDVSRQVEVSSRELSQLKSEISQFKNKILSMYKTHIEFINTLPSLRENEDETENNFDEHNQKIENKNEIQDEEITNSISNEN